MRPTVPALQHVIHRLGLGGVAREQGTLGPHPGLEIRDQKRAPLAAHREAPLGSLAVDRALDIEQRVDARHRLQSQRRDRRRALAAPLVRRDVGELVELAPPMRPTQRLGHESRRSAGRIEPLVSGIGIGLQDPGEAPKMLDRVIAGTIPRVAEQRRRRVRTGERRIVAHIDPGPRRVGLALGQHRHGRVVAVQTRSRQHVGRNQVVQRLQRHRAGTHLVGQRRQAEIDALSRVAIPLPVQQLMHPVLLEENHCQQVRARPAARHHVERRRRLRYLLAAPAGVLLAHRLDDLPLARDHFQRLRHILADLRQPVRSAAGTGRGRRHYHALARQMIGEWLARRLAADEPLDLGAPGRRLLGRELVFARARRELIERQFQLVEQTLLALGAPAVERAFQLLNRQRQRDDHRRRRRRTSSPPPAPDFSSASDIS